ncbi:MAG: UDP-N-acetylmuramoyl-L-alanine--D-glutamate ligase [Chloroflexi bacterium]|nr:UDP-N-acetylmuramoyl-L-alanine--D-glutamate ligase [Chloroflexota bacterium]
MDPLTGKRLLILGLARQGKALARFAVGVGAKVTISDLRSAAALQSDLDELSDLQLSIVLGEHPMTLLERTDMLAISGGVPADAPFVQAARQRGFPITNDEQEFIRRTPTDVIGITGSAGKTTTTALTGVMAQVAGRRTWVGGNIGRPLIADLHKMEADDVVVQELSSFQLEIWETAPHVAAVLNITPNHLDRHKTMTAYTQAKANILHYQSEADVAVLCLDDAGSLALRPLVNGRLRLFSLEKPVTDGVFLHEDKIWLRNGRETVVCHVEDVQLRGRHNLLNVCAAVTLADTAGIPAEAMYEAICTFSGVEHRLELIRERRGVRYINDSIATAPERALAALAAFDESLILLAGGQDKDMQWDEWTRVVSQRVKHLILFGELAEMLEAKITSQDPKGLGNPLGLTRVETVAEAVQMGVETAVSGDIVLLSPGGTSFDAYDNFALRGEEFRELVRNL